MAWYEKCIPSPNDMNVSVSLSTAINTRDLEQLPRPVWSAARLSIQGIPQFLCDPMECDRMAIRYDESRLCDRFPGKSLREEHLLDWSFTNFVIDRLSLAGTCSSLVVGRAPVDDVVLPCNILLCSIAPAE